jgi:hypothetical protein
MSTINSANVQVGQSNTPANNITLSTSAGGDLVVSKGSSGSLTEITRITNAGLIDASKVAFTPAGGIAATNVQAAIAEVGTDFAASSGASLIGYLPSGTGAVATTVQSKLGGYVSVFDFMTSAQVADVKGGTLTIDVTTAVQSAIDYCASSTQYGGKSLYLPSGRYKTTSALQVKQQFITIYGDGPWATQINFSGSLVNGLTTSSIPYFRPFLSNFSIVGNNATGYGIDFSQVTTQVYLGSIDNIYIESGLDGFYAPRIFSMPIKNVSSYSYNGHSFRAQCGPAVSWVSCYALTAGTGKAGYRLGGIINMYACNGVNSADYWGVFGNDLSSADGFQGDFSSSDLPDINLHGCNIEQFGSLTTSGEGIRVQNAFRNFNVIGGKIDRFALSTAYSALIRCRAGSNGGTQAVKLDFGNVFLGSGTPSNGYLYSDGQAKFFDNNDSLFLVGVTMFKNGATIYPIIRQWVSGDIYGDNAHYFTAISPRRLSIQTIRYNQPAALTPIGTLQSIVVTGYSKVTVTPAATASISTATFDATPNIASDYGRNGDLLIEAGNGNLTIVHTALGSGGNTFVMSSGANITMGSGQILRFCRSSITSQWIQV